MMFSFWEKQSFLADLDLVIVGSGIVGLSAALALRARDKHLRIAIVERSPIAEGASTRNAGVACFGSVTELIDDLEHHSLTEVLDLVERRWRGLQVLRQRVGDRAMQYEALGGFELFGENEQPILEACCEKIDFLNHEIGKIIGDKAVYQLVNQSFGFREVLPTLIHNRAEGQLHTGEMMRSLIQQTRDAGVLFFNGFNISSWEENIDGVTIQNKEGFSITAKQMLVATNGFARQLLPELDVIAARNQVLITKPIPNLNVRGAFHYDRGYFYFRNVGDRILFGGGRNLDFEGEQTTELGTSDLIQNTLIKMLHERVLPNYPNIEIEQWWSGILGMGKQKKPIIERLSPRMVVAVRMGGMGVAIGSLVGEQAAALCVE
jgi:gamma-glutamylputrescine oxidase